MRRRSRIHDTPLDLTPMIDVTFLLLVFFLCTLKFKTLDHKLTAYLPKHVGLSNNAAEPMPSAELRVRVLDAGERRSAMNPERAWTGEGPFVHTGRVLGYRLTPTGERSPEAIRARFEKWGRASEVLPLGLWIEPEVTHGEALEVFDWALEAGLVNVDFLAVQ